MFVAADTRVMTVAKRDFVPVDLGALRDTGFTMPPKRGPGRLITVELVFGGPSTPYAIAVHEHPSIFDPPSWKGNVVNFNVGGPKYLERPLLDAAPTILRDIAANIDLQSMVR